MPRRSGNGDAAWAREVIRPPNDLPPANIGSSGNRARAAVHTARTAASATSGRSGRANLVGCPARAAMNGNSQRSVAT